MLIFNNDFSAKDGHLTEIDASELAQIDRYRRNVKPDSNKRKQLNKTKYS